MLFGDIDDFVSVEEVYPDDLLLQLHLFLWVFSVDVYGIRIVLH